MASPIRALTKEDLRRPRPVHVVWEITLACDLKCNHCGSRAAKARPDELSTKEALDVVKQLAALGTREVTIIGGEAYLRKDWTTIISAIREHGMKPAMQTGARNLTEKRVKAMADAGLTGVGVSIDGLSQLHDELRGVKGSFDNAIAALRRCKRHGLNITVNTQISKRVLPDLRPLQDKLIALGVKSWQIQLTVAMGRAVDNDGLLLQPYELLEVMPRLYELWERGLGHGLLLIPGNNIGYFGPYEHKWRGKGKQGVHWIGCNAGKNTMGIEADGTIKGCPSLPTQPYTGGNVRDLSIEQIWNEAPEMAFRRDGNTADLWGYCKSCYYADICQAGCSWTTHSLLGRPGNNPYCHHRALDFARRGLRERVVKTKEAPGLPFDFGGFEIVVEPLDAPEPKKSHPRLKVIA